MFGPHGFFVLQFWYTQVRVDHNGLHRFWFADQYILLAESWSIYAKKFKPMMVSLLAPRAFQGAASPWSRYSAGIDFHMVAAEQGVSCDATCSKLSPASTCDSRMFISANTCEEMKKAFPCPNGCGNSEGSDQPAFVSLHAPVSNSPGACLIKMDTRSFDCAASHPLTQRLCPCSSNQGHLDPVIRGGAVDEVIAGP